MRGSAVGAALLLVAGLSVAVVPALRPALIDGTAEAVPIPGIPAVGDCVTEPVPYSSLFIGLNNPTDGQVIYPSLPMVPCEGPRYGEVVAVIAVPAVATVQVNGQNRSMNGDVNRDRCWSASVSYLGISTAASVGDGEWTPLLSMPSLVVQPSPRQQADGQSWLACLTFAQSTDTLDPGTQLAPYTGTLRDAVVTGNQTARLGFCADQAPIVSVEDGSCTRPYRYQQLAIAPTGENMISAATLRQTCTDTVNRVVGRDVTNSGELYAVVTAVDNNSSPIPITTDAPPNSSLQCGIEVTGDRLLAGSVIGLGDQPIAWS